MRLVNDLVSVIVPAYNAESYIERCINSIGNQSYSNFEIIVINDGSNDLTFKILENLEKRYKMLNVYDQANHGEPIPETEDYLWLKVSLYALLMQMTI